MPRPGQASWYGKSMKTSDCDTYLTWRVCKTRNAGHLPSCRCFLWHRPHGSAPLSKHCASSGVLKECWMQICRACSLRMRLLNKTRHKLQHCLELPVLNIFFNAWRQQGLAHVQLTIIPDVAGGDLPEDFLLPSASLCWG